MTFHAKYALRCPGVSQVLYFLLAVPTFEAAGAECLVTGEDGQILDLVPTRTAAICTIVADE